MFNNVIKLDFIFIRCGKLNTFKHIYDKICIKFKKNRVGQGSSAMPGLGFQREISSYYLLHLILDFTTP